MYLVYSLLTAIGAIIALPYFFIQGLRKGKYFSNLAARFGRVPLEVQSRSAGCIWVHAVSVGEVLAGLPLARELKQRFPGRPLVVSTTTATGQNLARERFDFADGVFYFPFDWAWIVRRTFRAIRPACVVVLETELWPNFLREARRSRVPVVFANGRISERSFRRHQRVLKLFGLFLRGFYTRVLACADLFLMQSEGDASRLRAMGALPDRIMVTGNLKYDSPLAAATPLEGWLSDVVARNGRRPLIVAGSVTSGEEPLVLIAFGVLQGEMRNALLVLAPRKPERFDAAARHIEESQRGYLRRSQVGNAVNGGPGLAEGMSVFLLDSIGELGGLYRLADAVFVGGSLVPAGGHNLLEPAGFGQTPLFGPSMENFQEVANTFLARGAARQVENPEDLGVAWIELIENPEKRKQMGELARKIVEENRGATRRTIDRIAGLLPADFGSQSGPRNPRSQGTASAKSGSVA